MPYTNTAQWAYKVRGSVPMYIMAIVLVPLGGLTGCAAQNMEQSQRSVSREWADEAMGQIDVAKMDLSAWERNMSALSATGLKNADMPTGQLIEWVSKTNDVTRAVFTHTIESGERFRQDLFNLWVMTGYCGFIEVPSDRLLSEGTTILENYRTFVSDHSTEPRSIVLRNGLEQTIKATAGAYGDEAVQVIGRIVDVDRPLPSHVLFSNDRTSPQTRQAFRTELERWLATSKNRLTWNPLLHQFQCEGKPCVLPHVLYDSAGL